MKKQTQKQKVLNKLIINGYVDNFWAFHNYILRLGAIIHELKKEGYKIEGVWGKDISWLTPKQKTLQSKNFYYILK